MSEVEIMLRYESIKRWNRVGLSLGWLIPLLGIVCGAVADSMAKNLGTLMSASAHVKEPNVWSLRLQRERSLAGWGALISIIAIIIWFMFINNRPQTSMQNYYQDTTYTQAP